jgi:hypothetical protein
VRGVAQTDRLPPPDGHLAWDPDAVQEAAHTIVAEHLLGKRRIDSLLLRATSEQSFEKLLGATVRNFFRDQLRKTARGALGRRFGEILEEESRFRLWVAGATRLGSDSFWGLDHWTEPRPYQGILSTLSPSAWRIQGISVTRWRADAARRSPLADRHRPSLVRFLEGVLDAAQSLLSVPQLVEVASYRFALQDTPAIVSLDEPSPPPVSEPGPRPEELAVARAKALHVYGQLSTRERQLLLRLGDQDYRSIAEDLALPKSTVFDAAQRIRGIIASALERSDDAGAVLRELELLVAGELA